MLVLDGGKTSYNGCDFDNVENFKYECDGGHHTIAVSRNPWVVTQSDQNPLIVYKCSKRSKRDPTSYFRLLRVVFRQPLGCAARTCIPAARVTSLARKTYLSQNADSTCHSNLSDTHDSNLIVRGSRFLFRDWGNELFLKGCHVAYKKRVINAFSMSGI